MTNFRREDLMKKEANYLNIKIIMLKCGEHFDATQLINPVKKHLGLYRMLSQLLFFSFSQPTSSADTKEEDTNMHAGPHRHKSQAICGGNYTLSTMDPYANKFILQQTFFLTNEVIITVCIAKSEK